MTPLMAKPAITFPNSNPEVHQVSSALYRSLLNQLEIKTSILQVKEIAKLRLTELINE